MSRRLPSVLTMTLALGLAGAALVAGPALANSQSPATCLTGCIAVFDTANGTFTSDPSVTQLTATVVGAVGAANTGAGSVGGPGGNTTVDLGTALAAVPITVVVGTAAGQASSITSSTLFAVAGGGGQAGLYGPLSVSADQGSAFPGGTGGSPAGPGVANGTAGTAFGTASENGGGGTATGGTGGTGTGNNGTAGTDSNGSTIVAGGAGGSLSIASINPPSPTTFTGGAGGEGFAGGGGGAVVTGLADGDGNPQQSVGAGGGGSGFLSNGFTATAGTPNTGLGSVTFGYSFTPTATTTATTVHRGDTVPVVISGLPSNVPFTLVFDGVTVGSGTSNPAGGATLAFVVSATQASGSFPVQVVVGGAVAASTTNVTVVVPALAATGVVVSPWVIGGAALFVVVGVLLIVLRRRFASGRGRH